MDKSPYLVGTDLTLVSQIGEAIERYGDRFLRRVFTVDEIQYCRERGVGAVHSFASRFAAKEATLKVLRPEGNWLDWRTIEVRKLPPGWCDIVLHGAAADLARTRNISSLSLSMSHETDYATAVVMAELRAPADKEPSVRQNPF